MESKAGLNGSHSRIPDEMFDNIKTGPATATQADEPQKPKTKTDHIRDLLNEKKLDITDAEVVATLAQRGIEVNVKRVYHIRRELKTGVTKHEREKKGENTVATTAAAPAPANDKKPSPAIAGITIEDAKTVKEVCDKAGLEGVKSVLAAIAAMGLPGFRKTLELVETLQLNAPEPKQQS